MKTTNDIQKELNGLTDRLTELRAERDSAEAAINDAKASFVSKQISFEDFDAIQGKANSLKAMIETLENDADVLQFQIRELEAKDSRRAVIAEMAAEAANFKPAFDGYVKTRVKLAKAIIETATARNEMDAHVRSFSSFLGKVLPDNLASSVSIRNAIQRPDRAAVELIDFLDEVEAAGIVRKDLETFLYGSPETPKLDQDGAIDAALSVQFQLLAAQKRQELDQRKDEARAKREADRKADAARISAEYTPVLSYGNARKLKPRQAN